MQFVPILAVFGPDDIQSVCHPSALLAAALFSLGVPQHPQIPFEIKLEPIAGCCEGSEQTTWSWLFADKSADGKYHTADLVKWWQDPAWLAAHPTHELTLCRAVLTNIAHVAKAIRDSEPRLVLRRGNLQVLIPVNATPEHRKWLEDQFEGRVAIGSPMPHPQQEHAVVSPE